MRLALFQPDIPQNAGTLIRLGACLGVPLDLIGPAGFATSDRAFRRAGLDYHASANVKRHVSFAAFEAERAAESTRPRLILLTTQGTTPYCAFSFQPSDILIVGRESAGVPSEVHAVADARIAIPMQPGQRSLNVAVAAAMVLGEALRQTGGFGPKDSASAT